MPRLSRVPNFSRPFRFRTGNGKTEPSVNDDQAVLLSVPDPSPDADQAQGFPSITSPGNKTPDVTRASATEDKAGKQAEGGQDTDASPDRQNDASALADFDFQFESDPTLLRYATFLFSLSQSSKAKKPWTHELTLVPTWVASTNLFQTSVLISGSRSTTAATSSTLTSSGRSNLTSSMRIRTTTK